MPGDAMASFISKPDEETKGMCTLTLKDLTSLPDKTEVRSGTSAEGFEWLKGPRRWRTPSRKFGTAVPRKIWIISYLLIRSSLVVAATMLGLALGDQSL